MEIQKYASYIKKARNLGYHDYSIKNSLLMKGWPEVEIDKAFLYLEDIETAKITKKLAEEHPQNFGSSITIFLDDELRTALEKRAKKNMLTLPEQVEDILRRSTLNQKLKKSVPDEKLDDKLIGLFSRKNVGQKTKKKKAKMKKREERKARRK
jgi:hypothetical protein